MKSHHFIFYGLLWQIIPNRSDPHFLRRHLGMKQSKCSLDYRTSNRASNLMALTFTGWLDICFPNDGCSHGRNRPPLYNRSIVSYNIYSWTHNTSLTRNVTEYRPQAIQLNMTSIYGEIITDKIVLLVLTIGL